MHFDEEAVVNDFVKKDQKPGLGDPQEDGKQGDLGDEEEDNGASKKRKKKGNDPDADDSE